MFLNSQILRQPYMELILQADLYVKQIDILIKRFKVRFGNCIDSVRYNAKYTCLTCKFAIGTYSLFLFICFFYFFFYLGFLLRTFTIQRTEREGEAISLIPFHLFHPLHEHLDISRAITAERSPLQQKWMFICLFLSFFVCLILFSV